MAQTELILEVDTSDVDRFVETYRAHLEEAAELDGAYVIDRDTFIKLSADAMLASLKQHMTTIKHPPPPPFPPNHEIVHFFGFTWETRESKRRQKAYKLYMIQWRTRLERWSASK